MARLWKKFDGEPFMINPRLGILSALNPRKRKRGRKVAKRGWGRAHMAWVRSFAKKGRKNRRRKYHARRNAFPVAGLVANPRRRHRKNPRHSYVRHWVKRGRRRYRRNPGIMSFTRGLALPNVTKVIYAGAGYVGTPIVEGFLSPYLPASITTNTFGKYAVRIGSVVGLTFLAKAVLGREAATYVGIGGGSYVLISAVREFAPGVIPGLSAYTRPLAAYVPGAGRNYTALGSGTLGNPFVNSGTSDVAQRRFARF